MSILLGYSPDGKRVEITLEQLAHHLYMLGKSGMGKTSALCNMSIDLMETEPNVGLCVIDPLGALVEEIKRRIPGHRASDVILFEARDREHPFALNPFAPEPPAHLLGQWADHVMSIFQLICDDADWNSRTKQALRNIVITLLSRDSTAGLLGEDWPAALDEVSALLNLQAEEDGNKPPWKWVGPSYRSLFYSSLEESGQIPVLRFWREFYDRVMTLRPKAEVSAAIGGAVDQQQANPLVRNIVGQTQTKINFLDVMNEGKILLVDLSGIGDDSANFLGSVIMAQLASATLQRERYAEPHFYIVADELYRYGNEAFRYISRQGRNFNVHLIAAQQDQTDMRPWQRGLMGNASNRVYFQLVPSDALEQAHEFDSTPPPAEDEFKPRYRRYLGLKVPRWKGEPEILDGGPSALDTLRRLRDGAEVKAAAIEKARGWIEAWAQRQSHSVRNSQALKKLLEREGLLLKEDEIAALQRRYDRLVEVRDSVKAYVQERTKYPDTPGTYHRSYSSGENWTVDAKSVSSSSGYSESSETGPVFDRVPGRSRLYSDVSQEIANELTHLPRQHAKVKLAALDDEPPMEATIKTKPLGAENPRWRENWGRIVKRTREKYTRPVDEVEEEVRRRDRVMRRAVETWQSEDGNAREYHANGPSVELSDGGLRARR